jgi:hypothetical protein
MVRNPFAKPRIKKTYVCEICSKSVSSITNLKEHYLVHSGERPFTCSFNADCKANFKSKRACQEHERTHIGERPYICKVEGCNSTFTRRAELRNHTNRHYNNRPYKCNECGKACVQQSALTQHLRTHSGEKPYICDFDFCGLRFSRQHHLTQHKRIHTGEKPYCCTYPECSYRSCRSQDLTVHNRTHYNIRPHVCDFDGCNQACSTKKHLETHKRVHTNERPYACTFDGCKTSSKTCGTLRAHLRTHTGERPFRCLVEGCGQAFTQSAPLRFHEQRCHFGKCVNCLAQGIPHKEAPWIHFKFTSDKLCLSCAQFKYGHEIAFRTEYQLANHVITLFKGHSEVREIYLNRTVPSACETSRARPDIRILTHRFGTIIIELDENQHRAYLCSVKDIQAKWQELLQGREKLTANERRIIAEDSRLSDIFNADDLQQTVVFRLNPDDWTDEEERTFSSTQIPDVSGNPQTVDVIVARDYRFNKVCQDISDILDDKWDFSKLHFIHVVYWFFEGPQRRESFVPIDGDEYKEWVKFNAQ